LGRLRSYSLDDLYEYLSKEQKEKLGDDFIDEEFMEDGEEEESRGYDYADRQQLWSTPEDGTGWVQIGPTNTGPDPTKGPVERQVSMEYTDAMMTDKVDESHKRYWFTEPPGGWNTKPKWVKEMETEPGFIATAVHKGPGRRSLSDLSVGEPFCGVVLEMWYHHGIKVDIGAEYDGLLPMDKSAWAKFGNKLDIGHRVDVVIAKLWKEGFYRWPIQLAAMDPKIQRFMIPTDEWDPPVDMRGKSLADIERYTNRRLPTEKWFVPEDMEKLANPHHNTKNIEGRPTTLPFDEETWFEIQQDYFDDMIDASLSLRDYNF